MSKTLVVSLGTDHYFAREARRLEWSLKKHGEEHRVFAAEYPPGCPNQSQIPMGYKPFLMQQAFDEDYDMVLWLDSKLTVLDKLDRMWEHIEEHGHFATNDGWKVGQWISDDALKWVGLTREEAFNIPETSTAFFGLHKRNRAWLDEWERSAREKLWNVPSRAPFKGAKVELNRMEQFGSRGEQPIASSLFHKMNMELVPGTSWWCYEKAPENNELVVCSRLPVRGPDKPHRTWTKDFWLPPDENNKGVGK